MNLIDKSRKSHMVASSDPDAKDVDGKKAITVAAEPGEDPDVALAKAQLHPVYRATTTLINFDPELEKRGVGSIAKELGRHVENVVAGDLRRAESILISQANTLDVIFNQLAAKAGANVGKHIDAVDKYLRMALKAQSQCRSTLEALAEIKAPKSPTFIKQANIAEQQQVNNGNVTNGGGAAAASSHEKNPNRPNELITEAPHATLDTGATRKAGRTDPHMATVGKVNRSTNGGGKGAQ